AEKNIEMLKSFTARSTSHSGCLISVPVDEEIVPIANAQSQQDGHSFSIEAKISLSNRLKSCYVLICPNCGQEERSPRKRKIRCMNCNQENVLVPRCRFDVNMEDSSSSTIGVIMDKEAEKLLSLTAAEIYDLVSVENDSLPMENIQIRLNQNLFRIQVKKSFSRIVGSTFSKLFILSCIEKENNKRSKKGFASSDEEQHNLSKLKQKLEPPTPAKKK
ncbi:hypothetical protein HAX54_012927, partial [Datura stramonium]|nr:hypothetical protein [Datura stramonium]